MEENNKEEQVGGYFSQEKFMEQIRASRLLLRAEIKRIMEEETGETYPMEENLLAVFNTLTPLKQQNINGKIALFQKFADQQ